MCQSGIGLAIVSLFLHRAPVLEAVLLPEIVHWVFFSSSRCSLQSLGVVST